MSGRGESRHPQFASIDFHPIISYIRCKLKTVDSRRDCSRSIAVLLLKKYRKISIYLCQTLQQKKQRTKSLKKLMMSMHDGNEAITILLRAIYMGNFLFVQPTQSFSTRGEQKKVFYQGSPAQAKCWKLQIDFRSINIGWVGRGRRGKWKVGSGMAGQVITRKSCSTVATKTL